MSYLAIIIALGIVILFGYWSGSRRRKLEKKKKTKLPQAYPLSKTERQTKLRRIK